MLIAKPITKTCDKKIFESVKNLYTTAFPKQEQVALPFLISRTKKAGVNFDAFYDEDEFVGLTYTISHKDIIYLWYLATAPGLRSKGYGSQIMQYLYDAHPNKRIVLNLDIQDETAPDSEIRKRRKEFYIRNGYSSTGYKCLFNRNKLDVMYINGNVTFEEFASVFKNYFGVIISLFAKPKPYP
ncbi:MAG: GNAT family N-acetyltransferase [Defluviitaleaceae bacterium]|nr:GNAT family N-acetyltransferase [Defluviitaleaceae bacterium]